MSVTFTTEERAEFDAVVARELPSLTVVAKEDRFTVEIVDQDILPEQRILRVVFATRPIRQVHYMAASETWCVLTGHVDAFTRIATSAPRDVTPEIARRYAKLADTWTTTWEFGQLEIASVEDFPWRAWLEERDRKMIAAVRERFASVIRPEQIVVTEDEVVIETWVVTHAKLVERTLGVSRSGAFRRVDKIAMEALPIPLGRYWKVVDGRSIPSG